MLCDDCHKKPATFHYTENINGKYSELHLCAECASKKSKGQFLMFPNPIGIQWPQFWYVPVTPSQLPDSDVLRCSVCKLDYSSFTNSGFLGCPACYNSFQPQIKVLLRKIQGGIKHQGKIPLRRGGSLRTRREIINLKKELQKAIEIEDYEKAVQLRDRIRELEKDINLNSTPETQSN